MNAKGLKNQVSMVNNRITDSSTTEDLATLLLSTATLTEGGSFRLRKVRNEPLSRRRG